MKVEVIKWLDATMAEGWHDKEDEEPPMLAPVTSVGFVAREDKYAIMLAQSDSENEWGNMVTIPKLWITSRDTIKFDE